MKISHHGAIRGVTGSCHELHINPNNSVLVDCGLFQGAETSPDGANSNELQINFPIKQVQALLVTHCHIDHVGRIPYLLAAGFNGSIICSKPTAMLLPKVLEDAIKIGFTRDKRLINKFIKKIGELIIGVEYGKWQNIKLLNSPTDHLKVKFQPAGHILGSAYIQCRIETDKPHKSKTDVLFSGDLGAPYTPLLKSPKSPYSTDILVIESTYGDRMHEDRRNRQQRLAKIIEHAVSDNGVVLIPAFSIGRTQEILYELEHIIHKNSLSKSKSAMWENIEIIVDSPLANDFTELYRKLKRYWDKEAIRRHASNRHPLSFEQLTTIDDHKTHLGTIKYLQKHPRPAIVLAASGMCAGGRIMNYLEAFIEDKRTDVLFVGYQAQGTPGHIIQKYGAKHGYVELNGKKRAINAGVHTISGYSAHADQKDLVNFVKRMRKKPKEIRIVHGDEKAKKVLKRKFEELVPGVFVDIP